MCSVEEDIEDLSSLTQRTRKGFNGDSTKCKKCGEKSILLLQKKDPFCRNCFFEYCDHKFRSTIGKNKKIKHGDKVLLAYSGGRKSAALLHMTSQALKSASAKQISFISGILFIDETLVYPVKNRSNEVQRIIQNMNQFGYPVLVSSLEKAYKLNEDHIFVEVSDSCDKSLVISTEEEIQLKNCLNVLSLSAKLDLIRHLRLLLITEIAQRAGYDYVFVGDSASSLAVNLLSNIALGRGSQISSDTNFHDARYSVPICRPIREFLNRELALYNHLHNCTFTVLPELLTKTDDKSSIQRLTESFVTNLEDNFPATVFTIFRTGGKLSRFGPTNNIDTCILCKSKLDNINPEPCSAIEALKISENLSQLELSETPTITARNSEENGSNSDPGDSYPTFQTFLCHGCSIPFRNKKAMDFFPLHLDFQHIKMNREQMKDSIKEYLLESNENS